MQMGDNYNPYNEVLEIVRQAADLLGYAPKEYEAINIRKGSSKFLSLWRWMMVLCVYLRAFGYSIQLPEGLQREVYVIMRV